MPNPREKIETEVKPNPAVERRSRRVFTPEYKLKIIQQADACHRGELGPLLRREKLYANQLSQWRREFAENGIEWLSESAPGPKSASTPEHRRIAKLEREVAKLRKQIVVKDGCLGLQKSIGYARTVEQRAFIMNLIIDECPTAVSEHAARQSLNIAST